MCQLIFRSDLLLDEYLQLKQKAQYKAPIRAAFRKIIKSAGNNKPHVTQTAVCWLSAGWQASDPLEAGLNAIPYKDDILSLLLYKETKLDSVADHLADVVSSRVGIDLPPGTDDMSIVRSFLLVFLEKLPNGNEITGDVMEELINPMILSLSQKMEPKESPKRSMVVSGSAPYCVKIRGWQALCVLSRFVTSTIAPTVCTSTFRQLSEILHGQIRFFIEVFVIAVGRQHPDLFAKEFCSHLADVNLGVQKISSLVSLL